MNCNDFTNRLDDYLDGELPAAEARAFESHAAACAACERTLALAKRLQRQAFTLPAEREPARDLWPEITARLEPRNTYRQRPWLRALAASVAVVALFAGGMLADRVLRESTAPSSQLADREVERLPNVAEARRLLPASYVELIEGQGGLHVAGAEQDLLRNLLVVNLAIREVEAAVAADPVNADLRDLLSGLYAEEHRILAQAERLRTARQAPTRTAI